MRHYELGKEGEKVAKEYLITGGYRILETNWKNKGNEIDIIARKKNVIAIVEVKSRSSTIFKQAYEAVDRNKQRIIIRVAESYIFKNRLDVEVRFDIITVVFDNQKHQVNHIKNAFYPMLR